MIRGSNAHEQCVTRCPVFRLIDSPGRPASVITWKISTQDPGITTLGSQLTGLARCHVIAELIFVAFNLGAGFSAKRGSPAHVIRPLSSPYPNFTPSPLISPIFQSSRAHTQPSPSTSSYPLLYIK